MRYHLLFMLLVKIFTISAQNDYKGNYTVEFNEYVDSLETSFGINVYEIVNGDSILLTDKFEYFSTIKIFRNDSLIYLLSDDNNKFSFEIDVFKKMLCVVFKDYYIFKLDNRPYLNSYLILKKINGNFEYVGETETSSSLIFCDIDKDGLFEIGGFKYLFEVNIDEYGPRLEVYKDMFHIYEISDSIRRDTDIEYYFTKMVLDIFDKSNHDQVYEKDNPYFDYPYVITENSISKIEKYFNKPKYSYLSKYKLTDEYLKGIPKDQLRIMRNEIFAKHGYIFKSPDLLEYFSKFNWYVPKHENVADKLTAFDIYNIRMIKQLEDE